MVKKRGQKFFVSNRVLYTFIILGIIVVLTVGAYAALLTPGVAPNPGHLITDIAPPSGCSSGQFLEFSGGTWMCAAATSPPSQWSNSGSNIYYNSGNVGVGKVPSYPLDVNGIINAQSYYLNGLPISTGLSGSIPLEPLAYTDSNGNWQWTQASITSYGNSYNAPQGWSQVYSNQVQLNPTRPVLGIRVSGNTDDFGYCLVGINGFFFGGSLRGGYLTSLNTQGNFQTSFNDATSTCTTGVCQSTTAGSLTSQQWIFSQDIPGFILGGNTGIFVFDNSNSYGYDELSGLLYIPEGGILNITSQYYNIGGPANITCNVSVLYGDYSINPISAAAQAAADQAMIASQCANANGTWINNVCRFNSNSCPVNWKTSTSWTTTTSNSVNNGICSGARSICTTGGHAWSSSPIENCSYTNESSYMGSSGWVCNDVPNTLYATVTQAGCLQEFPQ